MRETLRRCLQCGFLAYKSRPCNTCDLFAGRRLAGGHAK
jgi:hypothetical protein